MEGKTSDRADTRWFAAGRPAIRFVAAVLVLYVLVGIGVYILIASLV